MTPADNLEELVAFVTIVDHLGWAVNRDQLVYGLTAHGKVDSMTEAEVDTALTTAVDTGRIVAFDDNGMTLYSITEYTG